MLKAATGTTSTTRLVRYASQTWDAHGGNLPMG